jgi:hypothetical protein
MQYRVLQQDQILEQYANQWVNLFMKTLDPMPLARNPSTHMKWVFKKSTEEFNIWLQAQGKYSLFFHGASRGNPGATYMGGSFLDPGGNAMIHYA